MNTRMILPILILIPFSILSIMAIEHEGLLRLYTVHLTTLYGGQILADLVIACFFGLGFLIPDARKRGINPWPFVAVTVVFGSFGLLFYLVRRAATPRRQEERLAGA